MKKKLNFTSVVLAFIVVPFFTVSCKDDSDKPEALPPAITAISPENGEAGAVVTLTGSDFGTDPSVVRVHFNTTVATTVLSVTDTQVKVEAPAGFSDHVVAVSISVSDRRSNDLPFYYVDTTPPSISSATATCFAGSAVVISGNNFGADIADNTVMFGAMEATVTDVTKTSLTVIAPDLGSAAFADITVTKSGMVSNAWSIAVDVDQNTIATYNWTAHTVKPGVTYKTGQFTLFGPR